MCKEIPAYTIIEPPPKRSCSKRHFWLFLSLPEWKILTQPLLTLRFTLTSSTAKCWPSQLSFVSNSVLPKLVLHVDASGVQGNPCLYHNRAATKKIMQSPSSMPRMSTGIFSGHWDVNLVNHSLARHWPIVNIYGSVSVAGMKR